MGIAQVLDLLQIYESEQAFNQYRQAHPDLDRPDAPAVRLRNLHAYLQAYRHARYILVGEAAGYAGCRFSGIPFTSEAQLVGQGRLAWAWRGDLERSSLAAKPWAERSAAMVWEAIDGRTDCLLWNAFPWHPFGERGPLSNQNPGRHLAKGLEVLTSLLGLFPNAEPHAVGRVAQRALSQLGIDAPYIRHPSHGGKRTFLAGLAALPCLSPAIRT